VDASSRNALRWVLLIGGILGLVCALTMLVVTLAQFGHSRDAVSAVNLLPRWALWSAAPPAEVGMLIVGALCALLLVAGNWPMRACAAVVAVWFTYAQAAYGPGSRLSEEMGRTLDLTPFYVGAFIGVGALGAVSVLALVVAVRLSTAGRVLSTVPATSGP